MESGCCNVLIQQSPSKPTQILPRSQRRRIFKKQWEICCNMMQKQAVISCGHAFHQECLEQYYQALIQSNEIKLNCPSMCGKILDYYEVKKFTTKVNFQKYERNVLNIATCANIQFLFCPTAECAGVFQVASDDIQYIDCNVCHKEFCVICKKESHGELDCDIGDEIINNEAINKAGFRKYPYCRTTAQRTEGCNAVECKCGNQFCYDCGGTSCTHGDCLNNKEEKQL